MKLSRKNDLMRLLLVKMRLLKLRREFWMRILRLLSSIKVEKLL